MKAARIEFPQFDGGLQKTQGTKVITEDGEIHGIKRMDIHVEVDDVLYGEIELYPAIEEINGVAASFTMDHPLTGNREKIAKVIFADGSEVDFGEIEREPVDPEEIEITTFKSTAREFVFGIKPPMRS